MNKGITINTTESEQSRFANKKLELLREIVECNNRAIDAIQEIKFITIEGCTVSNTKGAGIGIQLCSQK